MPKILEDCVRDVQAKIKKGELPKGSSAYGICISSLRESGKITQGEGSSWKLARSNEMDHQLKK